MDGPGTPGRVLRHLSLGLVRARRVRRLLELAGHPLRAGLPGPGEAVAVWGHGRVAARGEWAAARAGAPLWRLEDAFLRSVLPGRSGAPPLGIVIDRRGIYYDTSRPSDLEHLLNTADLDADADRARAAIAFLRREHLSKYAATHPAPPQPEARHVVVVDQTRGDAAIAHGGAGPETFRAMLAAALAEHPDAEIVIRTHPETRAGLRPGHFGPGDASGRVRLDESATSPWDALAGARAVYCATSLIGFEAILAGHRPHVFGQPFYAGWGLTQDRQPMPRRTRALSVEALFAGAMFHYPLWYDPCADALCDFETAARQLAAEARAWREDVQGYEATGMRLWKRARLRRFFASAGPRMRFSDPPARAGQRAAARGVPLLAWAGKVTDMAPPEGTRLLRVEDGFLRSRGLGAALVPPLSLVYDDLGIYYDTRRESRLERLVERAAATLTTEERARAEALIATLRALGVSKYNTGHARLPPLPPGHRILVPGQVEDDASIRLGAGAIATNRDLLRNARNANPDAVLVYKPHPDVEAGLRPGALPAEGLADVVLSDVDAATALSAVDEVWTMTSTLGFEALIRGLSVTCTGAPFYAGWGLTRDLGAVPARRQARPDLAALVHAVLIAYPRYVDPVSGLPCPVEAAVARLADPGAPHAKGPALRWLARLQGVLATHAWLWR